MSDDISAKLQQIKEIFNNEQASNSLMSILSSLTGNKEEPPADSESKPQTDLSQLLALGGGNKDALLSKLTKLMGKKDSFNDPRAALLNAIKPYLSVSRQRKVDMFLQFLNLSLVAKLFKEDES